MLFRNDKKDPPKPGALRVPLLPLRDIIVFPHMVVPLFVGRQRSIRALEEAMSKQKFILLAAQKDAKTNDPTEDDIYQVGTLGSVVQLLRLPDGTVKVLIEGKKRARVAQYVDHPDFFLVEVDEIVETCDKTTELEALIRSVNSTVRELRQAQQEDPARDDHVGGLDRGPGAARRHDRRASRHQARRQADAARAARSRRAAREGARLHAFRDRDPRVEKRIRTRVKKQMEKTQKEYYLNEQMRAIQKELGEKDEFKNEVQELERRSRRRRCRPRRATRPRRSSRSSR
jgi:ATP-dependent Lon protease